MTQVRGMGDFYTDVNNAVAIARSADNPTGLSQWFATKYTEFSRLPNDIFTLQTQVTRALGVVQKAGGNTAALDAAQRDIAQLTAQLPAVQTDVNRMLSALAPVLPDIQAGRFQWSMLTTLLFNGIDVLQTVNDVEGLFQLRDDAKAQLQATVSDPTLDPSTQQAVANAIRGTNFGTWVKWGLIAAGGFLVFSTMRKVR